MQAATETATRKKVMGLKLDKVRLEAIDRRCDGLSCNFTEYVKALIDKDLAGAGLAGTDGGASTGAAKEPEKPISIDVYENGELSFSKRPKRRRLEIYRYI